MSLLFTSVPFFCVSDLFCFALFPLFSFVVFVFVLHSTKDAMW